MFYTIKNHIYNLLTSTQNNASIGGNPAKVGHFYDIINHCKILPCVEELIGLLASQEIPISQKNGNQVLKDLIEGFYQVWRKDGSHYIEHLIQTLKNTKKYDESFDHDSVLIALLHDNIEDTEESFESIQKKYGDTVALGVQVLSKKPFWEYIPQWNSETHLCTDEAVIFSDLKQKIETHIGKKIDHDFKLSDYNSLPINLIDEWKKFESKYKKIRNEN